MSVSRPLFLYLACSLQICGTACAVSFDGYMLDESDAGKGTGGGVGAPSGGTFGASGAGASLGRGGASGVGGDASSSGGSSATGGLGGTQGGGAGGGGSSGASGSAGVAGAGAGGGSGAGGSTGTGGKSGSSGSSGTGGGSGTGGAFSCPVGLPGPSMEAIPKPGGGFYCIDRTEVTNQQYGAFLSTNPMPSQQPAYCSWNTSFAPATGPSCASPLPYDPVGKTTNPVSCVDWCDARAYCLAAQKRLCGRISGGALTPSQIADPAQSQWYSACSTGGTRRYPYGSQYNGATCNGLDYNASGSVPVNSLPLCQGGYPNVYDMSGNLREWEDGCAASAGANDGCPQRGGGYLDDDDQPPVTLECSNGPLAPRNTRDRELGFRCCTDG